MAGCIMTAWAVSAVAQALLLVALRLWAGRNIRAEAPPALPDPALPVSLIIPLTGRSALMEEALGSLAAQDYPGLEILLVTSGEADPARGLALDLAARHPRLRHVEAPPATRCGQKNRNLLAGLNAGRPDAAVFAFCDAGHVAEPDFIRQLVAPILAGRAAFCSGYHRTALDSDRAETVACHCLTRLLGLLQSLPLCAQPWGGALAVQAGAFRTLGVAELWSRTVVDDVSLAGLLMRKGLRVAYRPGAMLSTPLTGMGAGRLDEWFFRQIAYPRLYTPAIHLAAALGLLWFAAGLGGAVAATVAWAGGFLPPAAGSAVLYPLLAVALQEDARGRIAPHCSRRAWFKGLSLALWTAVRAFARTVRLRELVWSGIRYRLDARGRVLDVRRPPEESRSPETSPH